MWSRRRASCRPLECNEQRSDTEFAAYDDCVAVIADITKKELLEFRKIFKKTDEWIEIGISVVNSVQVEDEILKGAEILEIEVGPAE